MNWLIDIVCGVHSFRFVSLGIDGSLGCRFIRISRRRVRMFFSSSRFFIFVAFFFPIFFFWHAKKYRRADRYPEVLGSILGALKAIVNVIGMNKVATDLCFATLLHRSDHSMRRLSYSSLLVVQQMTPPIKDLLPRLTPILRNRHEKVQEVMNEHLVCFSFVSSLFFLISIYDNV